MDAISPVSLRRRVASLALALLATAARADAASAAVPDGVYAALAANDALPHSCATAAKMTPIAYVKHAAAVRVLHLTSGPTVYLASISAPRTDDCYYGSRVTALARPNTCSMGRASENRNG